ncbi:MAG TPA: hypothetical protein VEA80_13205 [Vitreimonas sp.]|uniref:hypothetical protein n=1 Tax=Vitreimonas sp. TaxID=3069702 RepID=UPI002D6CFBF4|nr:hypothetical protein [Vitreimonas sp.]HYD88427.1 hypothetical protein [Vitreimonas sp.]
MRTDLKAAVLAACILSLPAAAFAQDAVVADPISTDPLAEVEALSAPALDAQTIVTDVFVAATSSQTLTATNSGNTVTGQTIGSGDIVFNSDAMSGFDGIGNFVLNTGHNNNLQGSISVVIALPPAPGS